MKDITQEKTFENKKADYIKALKKSIKNQTRYMTIMAMVWIGFLLYGTAYKDIYLLLNSNLFFTAAAIFYIAQKIDKSRLEGLI